MSKIRPVILCGGSGTRLWPISRSDYPKQFVEFPKKTGDENSLFRYALNRILLSNICGANGGGVRPLVIASNNYRFFVSDQLKAEGCEADVFLEPIGRNTAPSLTMAALASESEDPILVVLPSDQAIDNEEFNVAVRNAIPECEAGNIVLLGIQPTYPETGYGYIKTVRTPAKDAPVEVDRFVEKPDIEKAKHYLEEASYLWNSGIFILKASVWLHALKLCRPDIESAARSAWTQRKELSAHEMTIDREIFLKIPSESVDFAVLEKCQELGVSLKVISFNGKWTDLGSWKSVFASVPKDNYGNFSYGNVISDDTTNSLLLSTHRPVVVTGLNNVAVIETSDAILVTDLNHSQNVKGLVSKLKDEGLYQASEHRKGRRPWGWYDSVDEGDGFKVKRIVVNPGCRLSLQRHQHRAEHWTVVSGRALVQIGDVEKEVNANETIYIPQKEIHRLTNKTNTPLTLIEVQVGQYLGEDDIERLEDVYGRSKNAN